MAKPADKGEEVDRTGRTLLDYALIAARAFYTTEGPERVTDGEQKGSSNKSAGTPSRDHARAKSNAR